jgi:hypothetical protein
MHTVSQQCWRARERHHAGLPWPQQLLGCGVVLQLLAALGVAMTALLLLLLPRSARCCCCG